MTDIDAVVEHIRRSFSPDVVIHAGEQQGPDAAGLKDLRSEDRQSVWISSKSDDSSLIVRITPHISGQHALGLNLHGPGVEISPPIEDHRRLADDIVAQLNGFRNHSLIAMRRVALAVSLAAIAGFILLLFAAGSERPPPLGPATGFVMVACVVLPIAGFSYRSAKDSPEFRGRIVPLGRGAAERALRERWIRVGFSGAGSVVGGAAGAIVTRLLDGG